MANWVGVVTNAGNSLLNEWVNEKELHFDSAATGTGTVDTVSMLAQTALVDQKQTASIIAAEKVSAGIRLKLRITAHTTGYTLNQYGIWATVTGGVSTMIALFQHDQGIPVPGVSESPDFVYTFYALIACSNAGTWTVNIDMSAAVTADELNEAIAEVEAAKQDNIMAKGILKGDGKGNVSAATPGQDYGLPLPTGAGKPTETTVGVAGQHYYDSSTGKEYVCTGKSADGKYLWKLAGISDASEITYDGTQKLSEKIAGMDAAMLLALAAAAPYSSEQTYALGAYCTRGGKLYRCTTAISAVEVWTDAHWTETTMGAELVSIYTTLANKLGGVESTEYPGCYYRIVGGIVEWFNPPLEIGIEYRTTERWIKKPVYVKAIDCKALPNAGYKTVSVGASGLEKVIDVSGCAVNAENGDFYSIPCTNFDSSVHNVGLYVTGSQSIVISTQFDRSSYNAYVKVKYTKRTD